MGIFDNIAGLFTGSNSAKAAEDQRNYLAGVQNQGNAAITGGYNTATGAINSGTQAALDALAKAYGGGTNAINAGYDSAGNNLYNAYANQIGALRGAGAAYDPLAALASKYGGATTTALGALGVGTPEQQAAARGAFTAGPGYSFNLDQGLQSIARLRNAQTGGSGMGGNADRDAQTYGAGLASQEYDKWLSNLLGFTNPELSATSGAAAGRAGALTNEANAAGQYGVNTAGLSTDRARMLSDLAARYGGSTAGLYSGQGNSLADLATRAAGQQVNLGTAVAGPYAQTYGNEAAAKNAAGANLVGLGVNAVTGLAGIPAVSRLFG